MRARRGLVVGGVALLLVLPGLPPSAGASGDVPGARAATATAYVQTVRLRWRESDRRPDYAERVVAPGIGPVRIVCRPDAAYVRIKPYDRSLETQMWSAKFEQKPGGPAVAVKNARVYAAANANDTSGSGTGPTASEGLNQDSPMEDASEGHLYGVISSRPGRDHDAGAVATAQPTSFSLSWWWSGVRRGGEDGQCGINARFVTQLPPGQRARSLLAAAARGATRGTTSQVRPLVAPAVGVDWHGEEDAVGHEVDTSPWAGVGDLELECRVGRDSSHALWVRDPLPDLWAYTETITGEGLVADHVDTESVGIDPVEHWLGPIDLPRNGMVRVFMSTGTAGDSIDRGALIVSSYVKDNDHDPRLDLCETGVAAWLD